LYIDQTSEFRIFVSG